MQGEPKRIFLLSPASSRGRRTSILLSERADFELAQRFRATGASLGEVFSFLSGLYFRGKLTYADAFARPPRGADGVLVITPHRGLLPSRTHITINELREFATVPIDLAEPRYRVPLEAAARALDEKAGPGAEIVLLGSIATGKYTDILCEVFGKRLLFPSEFVGRGDMSRGGLMLRCVDSLTELTYVPVADAKRTGSRPPKLEPRKQ